MTLLTKAAALSERHRRAGFTETADTLDALVSLIRKLQSREESHDL